MNNYDVIVIGAGPGGYVAAEHAAKNGLKCLVIERGTYGGVCLNVGCIPTKALLKCSKVINYIKHASAYGIDVSANAQFSLNWNTIQMRKQKIVDTLVNGVKTILKVAKVDTIVGEASIINPNTVVANGQTFTTKNIIVATGSRSRSLPLPGFEEAMRAGIMVDSTPMLSLPSIPKTLTVIGGGVIGIEMAVVYNSFGTNVTIVQGLDRILELLDQDVSKAVTKILLDRGIKIITNAKILSANNHTLNFEVNGVNQSITSDYILQSVGRKANDEILNPLNIQRNERGNVVLNQNLQTSVPNVYVIGDAASQVMLAHYAYHHAVFAVDHILGRNPKPVDPLKTPGCIYIQPEVATVGYSEEQLKQKNIGYVKISLPMSACGKAVADGETEGFIKLLVGNQFGEILGAHMISSTASDIISELALVMNSELTIFDLANAIHPHPTVAEMVSEAAKHLIYKNFNK
ncbi:dihydrolipoyl dehydrogenase [Mycoplasmoides pirum]|uniref:dihydrolipoyl dehydrogenase n=1 Tax=Mycoplasmoides pirum TaxID=2122 RepID=UPI00048094FC|nr:dihydrolipoyl dehydrogenase [Mycoplasmoides pirum]